MNGGTRTALEEEHVLIAGGSSGIGFGVAEALLQEGARVTIVGCTEEKLRSAREQLGSSDRVMAVAADVTDEDQLRSLFANVGTIDHLIVTRGVAPLNAPVGALDLDAARRFIDVMVVSALALTKHAAPKQQLWSDMASRVPAGRIAKPADVAKAYSFLLRSELTTGIVLEIDGGHRLI